MKRFAILSILSLLCVSLLMAGNKKKKTATPVQRDDTTEIHWMNLEEVQVAMKKKPMKVYMDVYTDWCGWCKVMDKKTFSNKHVIKYMNQHFYAVKFNAEIKDTIYFMGKKYGLEPQFGANGLAAELMGGKMSYPTSVILEENFLNPQPIPGYLDVPTIEKILKYLAENIYKTTPFEDYTKDFVTTWK